MACSTYAAPHRRRADGGDVRTGRREPCPLPRPRWRLCGAVALRDREEPATALRGEERIETRARQRLGVDTGTCDDLERVEERAFAEQIRPVLTLALAALPAAQRDAVRLHVVDELPYATVASRLGCSELAARLRVMRGLNKLARAIDQGGGDG